MTTLVLFSLTKFISIPRRMRSQSDPSLVHRSMLIKDRREISIILCSQLSYTRLWISNEIRLDSKRNVAQKKDAFKSSVHFKAAKINLHFLAAIR